MNANVDYMQLRQLLSLLKSMLEGALPAAVRIRAEIASVQVKGGHCYMELSQTEDGRLVAKVRAVAWKNVYNVISRKFKDATGDGFAPGMTVLLTVRVNYHEVFGLSLVIEDVEPEFTLGEAELQKRKTMETLQEEGLMDRQKGLELSALPYRLAVISSESAAGYGDFTRHLCGNEYGFVFSVTLFEAVMQGASAPSSIQAALRKIGREETPYDAVLLLRGGGSVLDLACFDDCDLCRALALCPVPVFTAIGHDRDYHVADMVAYKFVKTPTALADEFIEAFAAEDERISSFASRLKMLFIGKIGKMEAVVDSLERRIADADPRRVLSRGYALVTDGSGVVLKGVSSLSPGDEVRVMLGDGTASCRIESVEKNRE